MLRISRWNLLTWIWLHSLTSTCCWSLRLWHLALLTASPSFLHKFDGIESRILWWPFQTTHVLVRFPLLDNVSSVSVAWYSIILENKVIPKFKNMCWGSGRVPENVQIVILVEVAFQWIEKPSFSVRHCTHKVTPPPPNFTVGTNQLFLYASWVLLFTNTRLSFWKRVNLD